MPRDSIFACSVQLPLLLLLLLLAGCTTTATGPQGFTLPAGEAQRGDLRVIFSRAVLEEGSQLTGSAYVTGGELLVGPQAKIEKNIVVLYGTLSLAAGSQVGGDVLLFSGRLEQEAGSKIGGELSSNLMRTLQAMLGRLIRRLVWLCVLPAVLILVGTGVGLLVVRQRKLKAAHAGVSRAE